MNKPHDHEWREHPVLKTLICRYCGIDRPPLMPLGSQATPLSGEAVEQGFMDAPMQPQALEPYDIWLTAVRWAEDKHGIAPIPGGKGTAP